MNAHVSILPSAAVSLPGPRLPPEARATLIEIACDFATPGTAVYGLGYTVAELLPTLHTSLAARIDLVAIDESQERLASLRGNLPASARAVRFVHADLNCGVVVRDASVAILAATSQQVNPLQRQQLLMDVCRGLRTGGCALVAEVVRSHNSLLNNLFAFHAQGSEHSSSQATAETMQRAGTLDEERALLGRSGFRSVEIFYQRYGFCGLVAIK